MAEETKANKVSTLSRMRKGIFRWRYRLGGAICLCVTVAKYSVCLFVCTGTSMEPTLYDGDVILSNKTIPHFGKIKRNDVICLHDNTDPNNYKCKRLVGMEGDTIYNDERGEFVKIPRRHIWIEGDNRIDSNDSRCYGPVPFSCIHSKVFYRFGEGFF